MALTTCNVKLAADAQKNCDDPVVGGMEKPFIIFNREDVDIKATKASKVALSQNLYKTLVVKTGKRGYWATNLDSLKTTKVDGKYTNRMQKVLTGALLDDGDIPASVIDSLASKDGKFLAVVEHIYKDFGRTLFPGSSAFEIIGLDVPLTSDGQAIENDSASADTDGGWAFALSTTEPKSRAYLYDTNYATTKTQFDALGDVAGEGE